MTYSLVASLAFDLILAINDKIVREIPNVTYWADVEDVSANSVECSISYSLPEHGAFCTLDISVTQDNPDEVYFGVHAELNEFDFEESDLHVINIEDSMLELYPLRPIMTQGITRYFESDENGEYSPSRSVAKRTFTVKFMALSKSIKTQDNITNYRFDEMSERVFPYIKSLYDVFKIIHPN
ncbi:hypothetical protein [Nitrosopumilus sp.]|uniref:hypothetical protein n=1 Tax=Nitrosopumilus sp. TaxID=2024843 RepID=UPI00349FD3EA